MFSVIQLVTPLFAYFPQTLMRAEVRYIRTPNEKLNGCLDQLFKLLLVFREECKQRSL